MSRGAFAFAVVVALLAGAARPVAQQPARKPSDPTYVVSGCVNEPGTFAWKAGVTVAAAIVAAGGYAATGEGTPTIADAQIRRRVDGKIVSIAVKADTPVLQDDDVVVAYPKTRPASAARRSRSSASAQASASSMTSAGAPFNLSSVMAFRVVARPGSSR